MCDSSSLPLVLFTHCVPGKKGHKGRGKQFSNPDEIDRQMKAQRDLVSSNASVPDSMSWKSSVVNRLFVWQEANGGVEKESPAGSEDDSSSEEEYEVSEWEVVLFIYIWHTVRWCIKMTVIMSFYGSFLCYVSFFSFTTQFIATVAWELCNASFDGFRYWNWNFTWPSMHWV